MMKIAEINMTHTGSTGSIMFSIADKARKEGHEVWTYSTNVFSYRYKKLPAAPDNHWYFGSYIENAIHYFLGRTIGYNGFFSCFSTLRLIRRLKKDGIQLVHLHNLHQYCFNLPVFFRFVKKHNIKVIWTLHDCWSFTGHCPHFDMIGCDKWKTGCYDCPIHNSYPASTADDSAHMYKLKKKWLTGIKDMVLVAPSSWLAERVKESFLLEYPVKVINNGIDLSVFKPTGSSFREKFNCQNKFIILGVASGWSDKKGLDVFIELAYKLDDDCQIVLVGTDDGIDRLLPDNIISVHRTSNRKELAGIYTVADVFVNPTREDTFPTVNIEALACGTPVVTFNVGGSSEIPDEFSGSITASNDLSSLEKEVSRIKTERPYTRGACIKRAYEFDMDRKFNEYTDLYKKQGV